MSRSFCSCSGGGNGAERNRAGMKDCFGCDLGIYSFPLNRIPLKGGADRVERFLSGGPRTRDTGDNRCQTGGLERFGFQWTQNQSDSGP